MRKIEENSPQEELYKEMHLNQTLNYVLNTKQYVNNLPKSSVNIKYVLEQFNNFVDPSDPDIDVDNIYHAYETAEMIRKDFPLNLEFQVIGLIHDLGKKMYTYNYFYNNPWSVVGDTYPVGCKFSDKIICSQFLKHNPDINNPRLNTRYGIYKRGCGITLLNMSYGHDEYLYTVLSSQKKKHKISENMMNIIRYHSFYSWHTENEYKYFENNSDNELLKNVQLFNKYDLYSKRDRIEITSEIKKYYSILLEYYFPENLLW